MLQWGVRVGEDSFVENDVLASRLQEAAREVMPSFTSISDAARFDGGSVAEVVGRVVEEEFGINEGLVNQHNLALPWVSNEVNALAYQGALKVNGGDVTVTRRQTNSLRTEAQDYLSKLLTNRDALARTVNEQDFRREEVINAIIRRVNSKLVGSTWITAMVSMQVQFFMQRWQWQMSTMATIMEYEHTPSPIGLVSDGGNTMSDSDGDVEPD